jgi:hypothetical protein
MSFHVFVFLLIVCLFLAAFAALASGLVPCSAFHLTRRCQAQQAPPAAQAAHSTRLSGLLPFLPHLNRCGSITPARASLARGQKQGRSAPSAYRLPVLPVPIACARTSGLQMLRFMRLFGNGKHGHTEPIQTFRCQACHTTFSERRHTPLYRLKTPSQQVAMVLTARAFGLDPSAAERVAGLSAVDHHEPF